jgi:hypothetical protein
MVGGNSSGPYTTGGEMEALVGLAGTGVKVAVEVAVEIGVFGVGISVAGISVGAGSGALVVQALARMTNSTIAKISFFMGKILRTIFISVAQPNHTSVNRVCQLAAAHFSMGNSKGLQLNLDATFSK